MPDLSRGANAPLAKSGVARVSMRWAATPADLDIACFLVGADGKVPSDDYMVFYNQPDAPGGAVHFAPGGGLDAAFTVDLDALPATVQKCVFTATLDGPGTFRQVEGLEAQAEAGGDAIRYALTEVSDERAVILWEVYRHSSGWKVRAVGQGFNGGLEPLARAHGVTVDSGPDAPEPAPPAPAPAPAAPAPKVNLGKVVLSKQNQAAKISLAKKPDGAIEHIKVTLDWTAAVDLDLHAFYKTKTGEVGHVYYADKGSKKKPPHIKLDKDAGVGARAGANQENMTVARLDHLESVLIATNIFRFFGGKGERFARYDGRVTVATSLGEVEVPLTSDDPGRWALIAKIDCTGEPQVVNINRVQKKKPSLEDF